ncbi:SLC13 family permease [Tepidamorphus sp. 3E244]|uniref:SLC13 family permease n=1 Tax=Tepidamorphus sp. 3E244 TaxID=3385498 RepID=UPI0038FCDB44
MTFDQIALFSLFFAVFAMMIWGRFRYDVIAFSALVVAVILGLVSHENAFSGFGHEATIIVALVLVVSKGLVNSGAVDFITRTMIDSSRNIGAHITIMSGLGAALSAFMNNVAALALLMPVDLAAARKAERSPALTLMPLSFATILGGLATLIGTPPNIIIAAYRDRALGESYSMFDFAPVGIACTVVGVAFVTLIGWRLIPQARGEKEPSKELQRVHGFIAELVIDEESPMVGKTIADFDEDPDAEDLTLLGLVRNGKRIPGGARREEIRVNDILVVDASHDAIDAFRGVMKLDFIGGDRVRSEAGADLAIAEVVVQHNSRAEGRSADNMRLISRHGVTLLAVSRQGVRFRKRVRHLSLKAGDILLLLGPADRLADMTEWLGALPLAERGLQVTQHGRAGLAAAIFIAAVALASFGFIYLPVALAAVVILYVLLDIVPLRQVYDEIEWPVVILLGSMIPLGVALEESGGTLLIANTIVNVSQGLAPAVVLTILMVVTMTLSDVLNNTATAVIGAPIAVDIANQLNVSPDPFLMAVAVAASCAFLTPIGHKNNTLILGPGGYKFGDYWRMGLPLEIIVIAVAVPVILMVWPL